MKSTIFDECFKHYKENFKIGENWHTLSEKLGYSSAEALRSDFRRERKKRGIKKDENVLVAPVQKANHNAKILLFDTETSLINCFTFGTFQQNISIGAIVQDWHLICWSAKWLFGSEIMSDCLTPEEAAKHDDKRICESIWNLLDQADVVIAHNASGFDVPRVNTRFLLNGMTPPSSFRTFDTLTMARKEFSNTSNKLDYWNRILGLPQKKDAPLELWMKCFYGDKQALAEMLDYNKNDVDILEDFYLRIRPFAKNHPNLNLWNENEVSVCPNCASENLSWGGNYYTPTGRYEAFRCLDCGAIGRSKENNLSKEKRKTIVR